MGRLQLLRLYPALRMPTSPTETLAKTTMHGMLPYPRQSLKQLQGRWQRLMHTSRFLSMTEAQLPLWTPLTGPRTKLSIRDGNCGQKRLDSPLIPWKVTQKGLKSLTSITGSMEREWDTLSHGKRAKPSSTSLYMMS